MSHSSREDSLGGSADRPDPARSLQTQAGRGIKDDLENFFLLPAHYLCIIGPEGRFRRVNAAFVSALGFTEQELLSGHIFDFVHPDDHASTSYAAQKIVEGAPLANFENRYRTQDGRTIWLSWSAVPVNGEIYATARDITRQKETELALRRSEARFRRFFDSNLLGIFFYEKSGRIYQANQAFLDLVGYGQTDIDEGYLSIDRIEAREVTGFAARAAETSAFGEPIQTMYRRRNGACVPVLVRATRVDGSAGDGVAYVLDVTDRKHHEDVLMMLSEAGPVVSASLNSHEVLESIAALVVPRFADWCTADLLDETGKFNRVTVYHRDPSKARFSDEICKYPPVLDSCHPVNAVLETGKAQLIAQVPQQCLTEPWLDYPESELKRIELARLLGTRSMILAPLTCRGRVIGVFTFIRGDSGRVFCHNDLTLAQELAHRAALGVENARLYEQSAKAIQLRDEFISIASHELRTPLTSLRLQLEFLQRLSVAPELAADEDFRRRMIDSSLKQTQNLVGLVDDLMDVSRIQHGRLTLDLTSVDFVEVVDEVLERFSEQLKVNGIVVERATPVHPRGTWDRRRIEQVITNLVSNAVKYGERRPIRISVALEGERVVFTITDEGEGISRENCKRIFERFERAVEDGCQIGGLGLGLYIVRQIVEAHGGKICVVSVEGQGSTFIVELPLHSRA